MREVGRDDHVVLFEQRGVRRQWFLGEDVECCAGNGAVRNFCGECVLLDNATAANVDDVAALEQVEFVCADQALGFGSQRRVNRQEVGGFETVLELDEFCADALGALLADVGIVGDDVHAQRVELFRDLLADAAEANDAERFAVEFRAEILAFRPLAIFQTDVCLRD